MISVVGVKSFFLCEVLAALATAPRALRHATEELRSDPELIAAAAQADDYAASLWVVVRWVVERGEELAAPARALTERGLAAAVFAHLVAAPERYGDLDL